MIKELSISGSNDQLLLKNGRSPGGSNSPKSSKRLEGGTGKFKEKAAATKNNTIQKIIPTTMISRDVAMLCHVFFVLLYFCFCLFFTFSVFFFACLFGQYYLLPVNIILYDYVVIPSRCCDTVASRKSMVA